MSVSSEPYEIPLPIAEAFSVKDRVAIVTGAGGFIGQVIAETFAVNGAITICSDRAGDDLESVVTRLRDRGLRAVAQPADLTNPQDLQTLLARATNDFGHLDILINNGAIPNSTAFEHSADEDFDRIFHTNLRSIWLLVKYGLHALAQSAAAGRGGNVVSIASINAHHPNFPCSLYAASKAGVMMLMQELGAELAEKNVRFNSVSPGLIQHPNRHVAFMADRLHEPYATEYRTLALPLLTAHEKISQPMPTGGRPIDVAMACLYLASPAARFVTAADLLVDGGKNAMLDHQYRRKDETWEQVKAYLKALPDQAWKEPRPHWLSR